MQHESCTTQSIEDNVQALIRIAGILTLVSNFIFIRESELNGLFDNS